MSVQDSSQTGTARTNFLTTYVVPLVLLVGIIGGIAWVTQFLDRWKTQPVEPRSDTGRKLLEFTRRVAWWGPKPDPVEPGTPPTKDYEPGKSGHYDFPFKNLVNEDLEVTCYSSSCDCTSVQACALSIAEWTAVNDQYVETPGEPLSYADKTDWHTLVKETDWKALSAPEKKAKRVVIKSGAGGVVRVQWTAKTAGSALTVRPAIWFRVADSSANPVGEPLGVPLMVAAPVRFHPARLIADSLTSGTSTKVECYAWSSTRDHFNLTLTAPSTDSLFDVETTPLRVGGIFSRSECSDFLEAVKGKPAAEAPAGNQPPSPHVRSAQRVRITIHESRGNQYLDLGSYHRKFQVKLDGFPAPDVVGPEVVGRVHGEITIGGSDDFGRIRFKHFNAKDGVTRTLELSADSRWQLEKHKHDPPWLVVNLFKGSTNAKRTTWRLEVTVPENTPGVRSLEDPDAVILRIVGPPERFVRIPIEGQLGGP